MCNELSIKNKCIKNIRGFALLQSMALLAGVTIVAAATLTLNQSFLKSARTAQSVSDLSNAESLLHQLMDGPTSCTAALGLNQNPIPLSRMKARGADGKPALIDVSIYFAGQKGTPAIQVGQKFGVMSVSAITLALKSFDPASQLANGAVKYRATLQLNGTRSFSYGSSTQNAEPLPVLLVSDNTGSKLIACSTSNKGEGIPVCGKGKVLNASDNNNLICIDVPRNDASPLASACAKNGGIFSTVPIQGTTNREDICIITSSQCPSGMTQLAGWSGWTSNTCFSGSTTGCNPGDVVTVWGHPWKNYSGSMSETTVPIPDEYAACGPLHDGGRLGSIKRNCYAKNIKIGCTLIGTTQLQGKPVRPPAPLPPAPLPANASLAQILQYMVDSFNWLVKYNQWINGYW